MSENEYQNVRRIVFDGAYFVPVCENCGRFVSVPTSLCFDDDGQPLPNQVECSKCGITNMVFEGYY